MNKRIPALVFAMAMPFSQGHASTAEQFKVTNARDLAALCDASALDQNYSVAKGFCLGYLDATWDYHQALTNGPGFRAIVCPSPSITRDDAIAVFITWANDNPTQLDTDSPVHSVMRAFSEKWPCTKS